MSSQAQNYRTFILREGTLNDNELYVSVKGTKFVGGYIAIIKEYIFETSWTNREVIKRFKSENSLRKYLSENYSVPFDDDDSIDYLDFDFIGTCIE
jgi:hypothetical protein